MSAPLSRLLVIALLMASAAHADAPAKVDLGWLAGRWCSADGSASYEESWLAPKGGAMIGLSREVRDGRMRSFEYLLIADVDGVPTYHAQPGGRPPTAFVRVDGGEAWVRFENKAHDFPQRIEYRRDGDRLDAAISGPGRDGKTMTMPFALKRCD
jgi:hypothetical protein